MAVQAIKAQFEDMRGRLYEDLQRRGAGRRASGGRFVHIIRVNQNNFVPKAVAIINRISSMFPNGNSTIANTTDITGAFNMVTDRWSRDTGLKDVTAWIKAGGTFIIRRNDDDREWSEAQVNRQFRQDVYNAWKTWYLDPLESAPGSTAIVPGADSQFTGPRDVTTVMGLGWDQAEGLGFSHDYGEREDYPTTERETPVSNTSFLEWMEQQDEGGLGSITLGSTVETTDVPGWIMEHLDIGWSRVERETAAGIEHGRLEWVVSGELGGPNPPWDPDYDLGPSWETRILAAFNNLVNSDEFDFRDAAFQASDPFTRKIATWEMKKLTDEYLKEAGFTKGGQRIKVKTPPKAKPTKRSGRIPPKKAKSPVTKIRKTRAGKSKMPPRGGKEKGTGTQASTSKAADLARLTTFINSRLPAEVKRNMGSNGALRNRRGRFARSVSLISLHQAEKTVVAKYTYLLYPYQTFENTGKRRWRLSYNPKTLIAKSIRNLARGRIQQKLTVRRV